MKTHVKTLLSGQVLAIYKLLLNQEGLSVRLIAKKLNIFPNAVYRNMDKLIKIGLIERTNNYPITFRALPTSDAIKNYLNFSKNSITAFLHENTNINNVKGDNNLNISFLKTRDELIQMSDDDIRMAKESIDHIVSGMELPAETILVYKKALDRGIKIRFIVQNLNELNKNQLKSWCRMGLEVKYYPLLEARIIIFDSKTVYLTSYNAKRKDESIGVRFAYSPIAKQMKELFENKWKVSKSVM